MFGLGFMPSAFSSTPPSAAETLLTAWSAEGFSVNFTDQSIQVADTGTPSNDYNSAGNVSAGSKVGPDNKISLKNDVPVLCEQADGTWKYQAHNIYLNSAAPANQSVTVLAGENYTMTITGTVSITVSGAAAGTYTAGDNVFTAATGTLTCGSTSGSGTVHLRRTDSVSDYVATAGAVVYLLPYVYSGGSRIGVRAEVQIVNLALYSNDFSQSAWTKSNLTAAKTATGPSGRSNTASTLTATSANATALQSITSANAARRTSMFVKRRTGSGNIDMTQDNGSTWTTITVTSSWTRVNLAKVTSVDPTVGLRIVTSGDEIDVAYFQHEAWGVVTSPVETWASTVTRSAVLPRIAGSAIPTNNQYITFYLKVKLEGGAYNDISRMWGAYKGHTYAGTLSIMQFGGINQITGYITTDSYPDINVNGNTATVSEVKYALMAEITAPDAAQAVNGSIDGTQSSGGPFSTVDFTTDYFYLGGTSHTVLALCGVIEEAMILPSRLTNTNGQTLTTL